MRSQCWSTRTFKKMGAKLEAGPLEKFGYLFYVVSPSRSSFEKLEDVPDYVLEVVPFFIVLILLEFLISFLKKSPTVRINDGIGSLSQGMAQELARTFLRGVEIMAYIYIYNNWRIASLPWNSNWTWIICFLGVDLAYYWFHRASHEVNILWASHQVHHSSEDYNLTTALRQSVLQAYASWTFNLPMAFFIPPSVYLVHKEFNLLYQFWIHTEVITSLGPLEYILNTPSHHRVHHGRNRYCIDKNYAGVLIIWDRMFGTFEPEGEKVVYGLTHPINSFDTFYVQLCHFRYILGVFWVTEGLKNKLSVLVKGPGWSPGKPRLGLIEDIPDVHYPMEIYHPQLDLWRNLYVVYHFILVIIAHIELTERYDMMTQSVALGLLLFQILSLTSIGALLDNRAHAPVLELARCLLFLGVHYVTGINKSIDSSVGFYNIFLQVSFLGSSLIWFFKCSQISLHFHAKTKQI